MARKENLWSRGEIMAAYEIEENRFTYIRRKAGIGTNGLRAGRRYTTAEVERMIQADRATAHRIKPTKERIDALRKQLADDGY